MNMTTSVHKRSFLPAAGLHAALPLYDPVLALIGAERVQRAFVERAALQPGQRVLEIGCGTGNVSLLAKRACPGAQVVGLDPDVQALGRARAKAARAGLEIRFDEGFADALPYADGSFDVVLSSFMWHHLPPDVQRASLRELRRVLSPAGSLQLIDFVSRHGLQLADALAGAGFEGIAVTPRPRVLWLRVFHCAARRAAAP
jgi:ubiquinone/menaquinone biosynthesis C-methylase UbiE